MKSEDSPKTLKQIQLEDTTIKGIPVPETSKVSHLGKELQVINGHWERAKQFSIEMFSIKGSQALNMHSDEQP